VGCGQLQRAFSKVKQADRSRHAHLMVGGGAEAGMEGKVSGGGRAIAGVASRHRQLQLPVVPGVDKQCLGVAPRQLLSVGGPHPHRHLRGGGCRGVTPGSAGWAGRWVGCLVRALQAGSCG
jgi:hypothetical protein